MPSMSSLLKEVRKDVIKALVVELLPTTLLALTLFVLTNAL